MSEKRGFKGQFHPVNDWAPIAGILQFKLWLINLQKKRIPNLREFLVTDPLSATPYHREV